MGEDAASGEGTAVRRFRFSRRQRERIYRAFTWVFLIVFVASIAFLVLINTFGQVQPGTPLPTPT